MATKAKTVDKRARLAAARKALRVAEKAVEAASAAVRDTVEWMPKPGSLWRKHPALLGPYERSDVWTYLHLGVSLDGMSRQHAVLQKEVDGGKPYVGIVPMETFFVEYVAAEKPRKKARAS